MPSYGGQRRLLRSTQGISSPTLVISSSVSPSTPHSGPISSTSPLITIHSIYGDHADDRRFEGMLLDDVYRFVQDSDPEEQDVILLGDFNLPPDDHGFRELTPILTPLFVGDLRSMISESNLYDNIWLDPVHVGEFVGTIGIDYFDETVFGKNDKVASQAVSDHRPIWGVFKVDGPDDDGGE